MLALALLSKNEACMGLALTQGPKRLEDQDTPGVYSYSSDTVEGPRAPAVKPTARHSSLTRVRFTIAFWRFFL